MISSVRGTVAEIGLEHAVVEVGGVGIAVRATPSTLAGLRRGEQAMLATSLVVREDSLTLFGFADPAARELFGLLQTVSGVGPRLALAMLAVLEPDKLGAAIAEENIAVLTQVPGIGKKGAERLVIELRDKVSKLGVPASAPGEPAPAEQGEVEQPVVQALVGLGFTAKQAEQAVAQVVATGETDTARVLRTALAGLGRKG